MWDFLLFVAGLVISYLAGFTGGHRRGIRDTELRWHEAIVRADAARERKKEA